MNIPPITLANARLVGMWVLLIILMTMAWHFTLRSL